MGKPLTKTGSDFTHSFLSGFLLSSESQPIECYLLIHGKTWEQIAKSNEEYFMDLRHLIEERETSIETPIDIENVRSLLNQLIESGEDILYWSRTMRRYLHVSTIVELTSNHMTVQVHDVIRSVSLESICSSSELQETRSEGSPWLKGGKFPQECLLIVSPPFHCVLFQSRYHQKEIDDVYDEKRQKLLNRHLNTIKELLSHDIINGDFPLYWSRTREEYLVVDRIINVYYDQNMNIEEHDIKLDLQIGNAIRTVKYQNMCPIY